MVAVPILESLKPFLREGFHQVGNLPPSRWLVRPWGGRGAILGYHRVLPNHDYAKASGSYRALAVSLSIFHKQMSFLRRHYEVVGLNDLYLHMLNEDTGFKVAVTFDDGYRDNLLYALPVLEALKIPATIYVVTRFPEGDARIWWFDLSDEIQKHERIVWTKSGRECVYPCVSQNDKKLLYRKLSAALTNSNPRECWELLYEWKKNSAFREYHKLVFGWEELRELNNHPLITIGAHTHTHPNLRKCSETEVFEEMKICKKLLEEKLDSPVNHFAFPFGNKKHADEREFLTAKKIGYLSAVTSRSMILMRKSMFDLPRQFPQQDTTVVRFRNKIDGWNGLFKTHA